MEKSVVYTTELIRKFPKEPDRPIVFVVYNKDYVADAEFFITTIHGSKYLYDHVTVVPINDTEVNRDPFNVQVWIDPTVFQYLNSWSN